MVYSLAALEPANNIVAIVVQERGLVPVSVPLSSVHVHEGLNILDVELEVVVFLL